VTPAETIAAAVEKLEWAKAEYVVAGAWLCETPLDASDPDLGPLTNDETVVMLFGTIDAQLAILRGFHDHLTNPAWDHDDDEETAPVVVEVTALARAILGEAS
jgi:hypothetical protein